MNELQRLAKERQTKYAELLSLNEQLQTKTYPSNDEFDADHKKSTALIAEIKAMDERIDKLKALQDEQAALAVQLANSGNQGNGGALDPAIGGASGGGDVATKLYIPARVKVSTPSRAYYAASSKGRQTHLYVGDREKAQEQAYKMGLWAVATIAGNTPLGKACQKKCEQLGLTITLAASENVNDAGGFLVPEELDNDLIQLREIYGVARRIFRKRTMKSDSRNIPRRVSGLTAFHQTDGNSVTDSTKEWDMVKLTAEKIITLAFISMELSEDAIIDIGDDLAYEIAWVFAKTEDADAFLGDGSSTYGGFVGVTTKLAALTAGTAPGLVLASGTGYGTNWASVLLSDLETMVGNLPQYADTPNTRWVCHRAFYWSVLRRLMLAAGGVKSDEVQDGGGRGIQVKEFLGYPVEISQIMPSSSAVNQIPLYFGDFTLGASFGDRRETTIATSTDFKFGTDQIAIRGTERYAINVHDVGSNTAAGPIVGLKTGSS